ncbi:hypothetical protein BEH_07795 [Priestia filamentosa]|uniref:Uncharacterized protein n=1 Tax=Priestia filamentosa TaxID=1402861 RepID=A0A0H4KD16_9BACI|nr:hypothetical protein [Priestia filamentosa]AKO92012.1 hypothetical protein BEH_07795 [Priestia filamentosa]
METPKYNVGEKFYYLEHASGVICVTVIGVAPEPDSDNKIIYFTKHEYEFEGKKYIDFVTEEESFLNDCRK